MDREEREKGGQGHGGVERFCDEAWWEEGFKVIRGEVIAQIEVYIGLWRGGGEGTKGGGGVGDPEKRLHQEESRNNGQKEAQAVVEGLDSAGVVARPREV